jgi:hypothetical protein
MPLGLNVTALLVALLYYSWRDGYRAGLCRDRTLRERVAYMLWTAAQPL